MARPILDIGARPESAAIQTTATRPLTASATLARLGPETLSAIVVLVAALALANYIGGSDGETAALWLLGIGAGFTLQRARFCFASAFRDIFLFGSGRMMNGILVGLAVATVGCSLVMFRLVPRAAFGILPPEAHVLPVGITTIIGGVLFGVGMVLAGGCVSGSLYRMAEGYVASWVSVGGIVIGLGFLAHSWNWWYDTVISAEPEIWLPSTLNLGYGGGVALTLLGLIGIYLLVTWWQSRCGLTGPMLPSRSLSRGAFGQEISGVWRAVFVQGWSPVVGGAVLGGIAVLMYLVHMPWGVTGELARWSNGIMGSLGVAAPVAKGAAEIGGCAVRMQTSGVFTHTFGVTVGLLPGAFVAALLAREFKLRFPKERKRYVQSLGGGVLMGYGSGLAIGCTIGAFFSSVASLSVSGWLFGLALAGGAYLGVQVIKRMG